MAKILKEKDSMMCYLVKKLCNRSVLEYQKQAKPPENESTTEIIETEIPQDELASDNDILLYESPKKKLKSTLESIGVSPVNIHGVS